MNIKHLIAATLALLLGTTAMAQNKKSFTLEDLMWGGNNYANIMPRYYSTAFWGDRLLKLNVDEVSTLTNAKSVKEKSKVLFTTNEVNAAIDTAKVGKVYNLLYAEFPYADKTQVLLSTQKLRVLYDWNAKKAVWTAERTAGESASDLCFASKAEAYVKNWNLYVRTADGKITKSALTAHASCSMASQFTVMSLAFTRAHSGVPKAPCWPSTAWTNQW